VGSINYCDTSQIYEYSVVDSPKYSYAWSIDNGNYLSSSENRAFAVWKSNGIISVSAYDRRTGCIGYDSMTVSQGNFIYNFNVMPLIQHVCDGNSATFLSGQSPTGGNDTFLYQWFESTSDGFQNTSSSKPFAPILGANDKDYSPTEVHLTSRYYREVSSNSCKVSSDTAQVTEYAHLNTIEIKNDFCLSGTQLNINGVGLPSVIGTTTYSWEMSLDSVAWLSIDSSEDLTRIQTESTAYYRRIASWNRSPLSTFCTSISNIVEISPSIWISEQTSDIFVCSNSSTYWTAEVGVENAENISINFNFQYKRKNSSTWLNVTNSSSVTKIYGFPDIAGTASNLDSFRFIIRTPCGDLTSDIGVIRDVTSAPNFNIHPGYENVNIGDQAQFSAFTTSSSQTSYVYWQKQLEGSANWFTIDSNNTNSYSFTPLDICDDNAKFRMVAENDCGTAYSNSATLTILDSSDIWMRDSPKDIGTEPNPFNDHYDIVRSPDIWNRQTADNLLDHQDMEFKNLSPNELYIKVRNRGTDSTITTPLFLYWTLGQINNDEWDLRWLDDSSNQFYNADSMKSFAMGKKINETPIMVPPIANGDSLTISYSWYPPNPDWYYRKDVYGNKTEGFNGRLSVCVLARLEHCEIYPHKMKIDEIFNQHVRVNAANNNNIITKNMWVLDKVQGNLVDSDFDGYFDYVGGSWTGTGRQQLPSWFIEFCFDSLSSGFFNHWNVAVQVDDVVRDAINNSLNDNPSITYLGDNIFKFSEGVNSIKCITKVMLPDDDLHFFRPLFAPVNGWNNLPPELFEVGMVQYNSMDSVDGAGSFVLDNTLGQLNNIEYSSTNTAPEESNHLLLSPNPTDGQFIVELDEETKNNLANEVGTIVVADGYGYAHVILQNISSQSITSINLSGYKAGVYNVRFEIANQVFYKYVMKTDE